MIFSNEKKFSENIHTFINYISFILISKGFVPVLTNFLNTRIHEEIYDRIQTGICIAWNTYNDYKQKSKGVFPTNPGNQLDNI